jgi:predicted nucleotidyltransferase
MAAASPNYPLIAIARILLAHGVEFIVIGGRAEMLMGSSRLTFDVDLCYKRSAENLERLAMALREMKPSLRGAPPDLPFVIDAKSLALGSNFTFSTSFGAFDLLGYVEPIGGYQELLVKAETYPVEEMQLKTISLDDLIKVKDFINRPKDQQSLLHLAAIKKEREAGERQKRQQTE